MALKPQIDQKLVYQYLRDPALATIKQLFKRVSSTFTQKAVAKAAPIGIGVIFSGSTDYILTRVVGKVAVTVLAEEVE